MDPRGGRLTSCSALSKTAATTSRSSSTLLRFSATLSISCVRGHGHDRENDEQLEDQCALQAGAERIGTRRTGTD